MWGWGSVSSFFSLKVLLLAFPFPIPKRSLRFRKTLNYQLYLSIIY